MKKLLLILGIVLIIAGVLGLLLAGLFGYAATHTLDGSSELYDRQYRYMFYCLIAGVVLLAFGIICLKIRKK